MVLAVNSTLDRSSPSASSDRTAHTRAVEKFNLKFFNAICMLCRNDTARTRYIIYLRLPRSVIESNILIEAKI